MVDLTPPTEGHVTDGQDKNDDVMFSSQAAMFAAHWDNFTDPESGIENYEVLLSFLRKTMFNRSIYAVFAIKGNIGCQRRSEGVVFA